MKAIKPFMLSMMLMTLVCGAHATKELVKQANQAALSTLNVGDKIMGVNEANYFNEILRDGGLYAFLQILNAAAPDVSRTIEYVALYKEVKTTNTVLSEILVELKRNNELLSQHRPNTQGAA